ncbi:hypothetical protein PU560_09530, partial [Georgenia sp. 10Sc9-8]|nr:hypothetical protein [Georgenia halotolerans]
MSGELVRATLQRLTRRTGSGKDAPPRVVADGDPLPVQLNPATLKLTRRNNVDRGGASTGTQKAQHPAVEGSTLALDLEFDTSEQGADGGHVDVREWTALVRQFVEPPVDAPGEAPPAVQFAWGSLVFNGIVESVTEDLDFFAPDGTPLHAKVSLSIAEQNFAYEAMAQGPATRTARAATEPGARPGTAPGSSGTADPQHVAQAQDGESAQQLLARLGQDPAAWRGAMRDLSGPLALTAGTSVQLGAEALGGLTNGPGGAGQFSAAPAVATPESLASALGQQGTAADAGFALSAAGGIAAAQRLVQQAATTQEAGRRTAAFATPEHPGRPAGARTGAPAGGPVDPRALTFGRGVPLQRRAGETGSAAVQARATPTGPATGVTAPW